MAALGITLAALLVTATQASITQALKLSTRQTKFQLRAFAGGMPRDGAWYAHECNGKLVAAGSTVDGNVHALWYDGVRGYHAPNANGTGSTFKPNATAVFESRAAAVDAYSAIRGNAPAARVNYGGYVIHNATCTVERAKLKAKRTAARGIKPNTRVSRSTAR